MISPAAIPRPQPARQPGPRRLAWLAPSFSDGFLAGLFAWLFLAGPYGWKGLLMDGDTGWHIRAGQYILAHRSVPSIDLFSFSRPGASWFAWEWLSDVLFAALYSWNGLKSIVLLAAALILALAALLLFAQLRRGVNPLLALAFTLLAVTSASVHFLARPHLFTLLLMTVALGMIESDRRHPSARIWLLVPLTALWTNLHGGVFALFPVLAVLCAGSALEWRLGRLPFPAVLRAAGLTLACAAATLLNPYGWRLHRHVWEYLQSGWIQSAVQEFEAPSFRAANERYFEFLLLLSLAAAGWMLFRSRLVEPLLLVVFAHFALSSARHIPLFAAAACLIVPPELDRLWVEASVRLPRSSVLSILRRVGADLRPDFARLSPWLPLLLVVLLAGLPPKTFPADFPSEAFPVNMVNRHAALFGSRRLLSSDQWGDYLIYRFYPSQKVFFDGRSDFYGELLGRDYVRLMNVDFRWSALLAQYRFDSALLPASWPLASLLKRDPRWRLIDDDGQALLFLLQDPPGRPK